MAYTPLTPQQYQSARTAGFSPDQIISNEKIRKQKEGGSTTVAASPTSSGFDINAPAYDMAQNQSGLLGTVGKETANIAKSGLKFGKGVVDFFNPLNTLKTVAKLPEALGGYLTDAGGAIQSEDQAQALEAKAKESDISHAKMPMAPVAKPARLTDLTPNYSKAAWQTIAPDAAQKVVQGKFTDALTSLANDPFQIAPLLLTAKEVKPVETAIDTGIAKVKDTASSAIGKTVDLAKTAAEKTNFTGTGINAVDNLFKEKPLDQTLGELDSTIQKGLDKGVKPTVVGKRTLAQRQGFYDKATNAVKTIADLKDQMKITDANGDPVEGAPQTVAQGAQATDQGMKLIWKQSQEIMKSAGEQGAAFDPAETVSKLKSMASNIGNSPETRAAAKSLIPDIKELAGADPATVSTRLAEYNQRLKGLYNGTTSNSQASVLASAADKMRGSMDASIEGALEKSGNQELRNQYGELKTLDKEMQHRATVVGRQAPKSLFGGITDAGAVAELARGLFTMNIADLASSAAIKGLGEYIKKLNSPDANVAKMFKAAYDAKDVAGVQGFASLRNLTPEMVRAAKKATDLTKANGGVTISLKGEVPTEGFSVATSKLTEKTLPQEAYSPQTTAQYISDNLGALKKEGNYIGMWIDNGKVYYDVPSVFKDVKQAAKAAKAADQLGIFDLSKFETIGKDKYEKIIGANENGARGNARSVRPTDSSKSPRQEASGHTGKTGSSVRNPEGIVKNATERNSVIQETIRNRKKSNLPTKTTGK